MLTVNHAEIDLHVVPEGFYLKGDVVMQQPAAQQNEDVTGDGEICHVLEKEKEGNKRKRDSMEQYDPGCENVSSSGKRRGVSSSNVGAAAADDGGVKVISFE